MSTGRRQPVFSPYPRWAGPDMPRSFEASCNRFPPSQSILPASISWPSAGDKLFVQSHGYPPSHYCETMTNEPADLCVFLLPPKQPGSNPQIPKPVLISKTGLIHNCEVKIPWIEDYLWSMNFMEPFAKRTSVENIIATFVRTIPRLIEISHEESGGLAPIQEREIANMSGAMYLFFLSGEIPYNRDGNIEKMARAFQAMWTLVHHAGGDEDGTRDWFQSLNAKLASADMSVDRIYLSFKTVRERFKIPYSEPFPLDFLPHTISNTVQVIKKYKIT